MHTHIQEHTCMLTYDNKMKIWFFFYILNNAMYPWHNQRTWYKSMSMISLFVDITELHISPLLGTCTCKKEDTHCMWIWGNPGKPQAKSSGREMLRGVEDLLCPVLVWLYHQRVWHGWNSLIVNTIIHIAISWFKEFVSWMSLWVVPVTQESSEAPRYPCLLWGSNQVLPFSHQSLQFWFFVVAVVVFCTSLTYTATSATAATPSIWICVASNPSSSSSSSSPTVGTHGEGRQVPWTLLLLAVLICMLLPMLAWTVRLAEEEALSSLVWTLLALPQECIRRARLAERITEDVVMVPTPWTFPSRK